MSSYNQPVTRALYAVVLDKDGKSPFLPESDEEVVKDDEDSEEEKDKDKKDKKEENSEKEEDELTVKIDAEGILKRIIAVDIPEKNYTGLLPAPENHVFYFENVPDKPRLTLHKYNLKGQESDVFMEGVSSASVSADKENILYRDGSSWGILSTSGKGNKPGDGSLKELSGMKIKVDPTKEWEQIFREGWRLQRDFLYVDNIHGAPWEQVYQWYQPWVKHVRHRDDLNYVIAIMGGEVAVGHSYTFGGDTPEIERIATGLLGADYSISDNRYRLGKIYDGENWNPNLDAPLAQPGTGIKEGDYLIEVNGENVTATDNLYQFFEGTVGRQTLLLVNDQPNKEGAKEVTVIPVRSERNLRMMDWVETNRRKVDEASDGKLAYVYVPNTSGLGYQFFNRYYFAQQDKQGAVIDERNNGGGSAADYMIDVMSRELQGYFNSKAADRRPFTTPMAGIWGPKVMVINERAGSGGDLLPYMFRKSNIGPIIGTTTWGGLVGIWDTPAFIDGGRMMAPRGGFFDTNGNWAVEAEGVAPPKEVINGNDPQLERAIEEAMKLLETEAIELKPEPEAPVRYRRPE
jgi:tricorn protease